MASKKAPKTEEEISAKEVAELIGMSRTWVAHHAKMGTLPCYRLHPSGRPHFRRNEIERWYEERTQTQGAAS